MVPESFAMTRFLLTLRAPALQAETTTLLRNCRFFEFGTSNQTSRRIAGASHTPRAREWTGAAYCQLWMAGKPLRCQHGVARCRILRLARSASRRTNTRVRTKLMPVLHCATLAVTTSDETGSGSRSARSSIRHWTCGILSQRSSSTSSTWSPAAQPERRRCPSRLPMF